MANSRFYYRDPQAPEPNQPMGLGVVAIIEQNGSLLVEKRTDSDRWALIGGALEPNETLLEALHREVKEETGLTVSSASLFGTFSDPSRLIAFHGGRVKRIVTLAYQVEVEPFTELIVSEESLELRFVALADLLALPLAETHHPIVHALLDQRVHVSPSGVTLW